MRDQFACKQMHRRQEWFQCPRDRLHPAATSTAPAGPSSSLAGLWRVWEDSQRVSGIAFRGSYQLANFRLKRSVLRPKNQPMARAIPTAV